MTFDLKDKVQELDQRDLMSLKYHDFKLSIDFNRGSDRIIFYISTLLYYYDTEIVKINEIDEKKMTIKAILKKFIKDPLLDNYDQIISRTTDLNYSDKQNLEDFIINKLKNIKSKAKITNTNYSLNFGHHEPQDYSSRTITTI